VKITKIKSNRFLRQAHFMLAVYCRAENNRLFLHKNVEMRPGFMAKWLEFNVQKTTYEVEDKRDADIEAASDRVQHEQEKMVETMKVRWELQKEKD